jgi:hypothetical protein
MHGRRGQGRAGDTACEQAISEEDSGFIKYIAGSISASNPAGTFEV